MAKLYFRYGTMNSAKSLNLIAVAHSYKSQGKNVLVMKPALDKRFHHTEITSRAGLSIKCDMLIETADNLSSIDTNNKPDCVIIDESQFLDEDMVDRLRILATIYDIPVICYGLKTDFRTRLFAGSKRLIEVADKIEEIKTVCNRCNNKALFNIRIHNGQMVIEGSQIVLGAEDLYESICPWCYFIMLN